VTDPKARVVQHIREREEAVAATYARALDNLDAYTARVQRLVEAAWRVSNDADHYCLSAYCHGFGYEQYEARDCPVCELRAALADFASPAPPLTEPATASSPGELRAKVDALAKES
jgi:hypothetical protein